MGRSTFSQYGEAHEFARDTAKWLVLDYMKAAGYSINDVKIEVTKKDIVVREGEEPSESKIIVIGIGTSRLIIEKDFIPDYMHKKAISTRTAVERSYSGK